MVLCLLLHQVKPNLDSWFLFVFVALWCKYTIVIMASSSGNSSGCTVFQNSGSEKDQQLLTDERKRKRMESNRESARRSRLRKQKHLEDLMSQVTKLRNENNQILTGINFTTQHYMNLETENSILRAQLMELSHRLESLNEILNFINANNATFELEADQGLNPIPSDTLMNPMNLIYLNQPIMASADIFQYWSSSSSSSSSFGRYWGKLWLFLFLFLVVFVMVLMSGWEKTTIIILVLEYEKMAY